MLKLSRFSVVKEIWLQGSRSPLREKQVHADSDWDFGIIPADDVIGRLVIIQPRYTGELHSDLSIVQRREQLHSKAVMIYPEDTLHIFDKD